MAGGEWIHQCTLIERWWVENEWHATGWMLRGTGGRWVAPGCGCWTDRGRWVVGGRAMDSGWWLDEEE